MLVQLMVLLNYGLILLYGILLSVEISGGWSAKKEKEPDP